MIFSGAFKKRIQSTCGVAGCLFKCWDQACLQSHTKNDDDRGKANNEPIDLNEMKTKSKV